MLHGLCKENHRRSPCNSKKYIGSTPIVLKSEILGCILEPLMKNLHLFTPQFFGGFDETSTPGNKVD